MKKMNVPSRVLIALASLSLVATYFLPVWFIFLTAPQYPEGLTMQIWLDQLTGQVEIINGLNHYIGMQKISEDMFPELDFLVYVVGFFIVFGLTVALTGWRSLLVSFVVLMMAGAIMLMVDFYQWGYKYGHELDPTAPIQVPGLSYQPPLIGHKQLLNFDAYSYPDSGGWVVITVGIIFFAVMVYEWRFRSSKTKKTKTSYRGKLVPALASVVTVSLMSCSTEPEPFRLGTDLCEECRMTIMDPKFGGELITNKGKIYKFDDAHCMAAFERSGKLKPTDISRTLFVNYLQPGEFLEVGSAFFTVSTRLSSPMGSNAAAFPDRSEAEKKAAELSGTVSSWKELKSSLK